MYQNRFDAFIFVYSLAPLEGGVSWSRAGPVATGTLLAGLAAAMEPKNVDWLPYNQGGIMSEKTGIFKSFYFSFLFIQEILLLSIIINKYKFIKFADSNIWSSTLAGDLAQSALLKRKGQTYVGPDGYFNNTLCPTEFMLRISNQGIRYH